MARFTSLNDTPVLKHHDGFLALYTIVLVHGSADYASPYLHTSALCIAVPEVVGAILHHLCLFDRKDVAARLQATFFGNFDNLEDSREGHKANNLATKAAFGDGKSSIFLMSARVNGVEKGMISKVQVTLYLEDRTLLRLALKEMFRDAGWSGALFVRDPSIPTNLAPLKLAADNLRRRGKIKTATRLEVQASPQPQGPSASLPTFTSLIDRILTSSPSSSSSVSAPLQASNAVPGTLIHLPADLVQQFFACSSSALPLDLHFLTQPALPLPPLSNKPRRYFDLVKSIVWSLLKITFGELVVSSRDLEGDGRLGEVGKTVTIVHLCGLFNLELVPQVLHWIPKSELLSVTTASANESVRAGFKGRSLGKGVKSLLREKHCTEGAQAAAVAMAKG